jgi:hypothetical protein
MNTVFLNEEYEYIHLIYGICNGNATIAVAEYWQQNANHRISSHIVFTWTHQCREKQNYSRHFQMSSKCSLIFRRKETFSTWLTEVTSITVQLFRQWDSLRTELKTFKS